MEQRPLRLGDILDDYCPRERRVTNHAIVAMVGEDVKQTRCSTCDAEHAYKGGLQPRRRKTALVAPGDVPSIPAPVGEPESLVPSEEPVAAASAGTPDPEANGNESDAVAGVEEGAGPEPVEGPVHRRLIRATLPRPEGIERETRPIPEFTMRSTGGRNAKFRGGQFRGNGNGNGNGHRSSGRRFGGGNAPGGFGRGGGQGRGGFRGGQNPQGGGGGKKRSR